MFEGEKEKQKQTKKILTKWHIYLIMQLDTEKLPFTVGYYNRLLESYQQVNRSKFSGPISQRDYFTVLRPAQEYFTYMEFLKEKAHLFIRFCFLFFGLFSFLFFVLNTSYTIQPCSMELAFKKNVILRTDFDNWNF
jgi:hypothetical protein